MPCRVVTQALLATPLPVRSRVRTSADEEAHSGALRPPSHQPPPSISPSTTPGTVSAASRRLRALAALSGSLTDALGPVEAADLVERKALSALGATSAAVVTLGVFPPQPVVIAGAGAPPVGITLHVVHAVGLPPEVASALDALSLDAPVPFAEVARTGEALFLASETDMQRYPEWGGTMIRAGARSAAIVPVWANGELRGVLGLTWAAPRVFDEDERAFVLTLGVMCAQAIMRAHLRDAERRSREGAEEANRSKSHFVATISHELRTPMNAILGYTELLADDIVGPVSAAQKDHLGHMRASGKHLMGLIEGLLGYARLEAGEDVVRPETVMLADVVKESLVLVRPIADQKGISINVEGLSSALELYTDPQKVRQILVNLLANAVKFSATDAVVLLLHLGDVDPDIIVVEVSDRGSGIALENQKHVFDPFWQEDPHSTHSKGSSGLGLSVSRQLARLLGGDVVLSRSEVHHGSTFVLSFPVRFVPLAARLARPV